jgi:CRISPR-associated protein Csm5
MRYRVTCLTPTLVGDGQKLSPIDYMVWRDQVNVLDQRKIFKLLSRGPRLDGYLAQLKKVDKLDFASWGGFAQNFAGRRIAFESASISRIWEAAHAENLFIPTFASGPSGPYLPASALKGALRTAAVFTRWSDNTMRDIARKTEEDRSIRRIAIRAEESVLGGSGISQMRVIGAGDSKTVATSAFQVYLVRVSTLLSRQGKLELGWKQSPRGSVEARRVDDSTPMFVEMAIPGTTFEGDWRETEPQRGVGRAALFEAANKYAAEMLTRQADYARRAGLANVDALVTALTERLEQVRQHKNLCLLSIGWGGGLLGKAAYLDTKDEAYQQVLRQLPYYARALDSGFPFPKTRRIVFQQGQPASLPGWVMLEVA